MEMIPNFFSFKVGVTVKRESCALSHAKSRSMTTTAETALVSPSAHMSAEILHEMDSINQIFDSSENGKSTVNEMSTEWSLKERKGIQGLMLLLLSLWICDTSPY